MSGAILTAPADAVALGDHLFKVYLDGAGRTTRPVTADNAREAAESYYRRMVMRGEAPEWTHAGGERVIVEHERGPEVDPSVTWHRDDEGGAPFVAFVVRVLSVDVAAEVAS